MSATTSPSSAGAGPSSVAQTDQTEPTLCLQANIEALATAGIDRKQIGFTCSGSCDYLSGGPFVFVQNLEAAAAWPPISESHVEMDGAWALYEAWVRLQEGDIDLALVFGSGKSSPSTRRRCTPRSSTRTTSSRWASTRRRSPACRPGR